MPRPKKSDQSHGEGIPPRPFEEPSAPATDLAQIPAEDLIDALRHRGFLVAKADEGRPEPVEVPAIEVLYDEVLAQELERRGWECFPPDGPDV
jgi:hypothetical protein